jgi:hypothetical protein
VNTAQREALDSAMTAFVRVLPLADQGEHEARARATLPPGASQALVLACAAAAWASLPPPDCELPGASRSTYKGPRGR